VGLVVAVLLLTGCTGEEESVPEPSNGPDGQVTTPAGDGPGSGGPSTEPEEPDEGYPAPERPEAMENNDIDGAEAAGIYFIELYAYSFSTGDATDLDRLSDDDCNYCRALIDDVLDLYDQGGYAVVEPFRFEETGAHISSDDEGDYVFDGIVHAGPMSQYDASGDVTHQSDWTVVRMWVVLSHTGDGWVINGARGEGV